MAAPLAVILAAGRGRRMGSPKLALELRGEPLLARAARSFAAVGAEVVAVVHNPRAASGPFGSLKIALGRGSNARPTFVLPVDVPCCSPRLLRGLLRALRAGAAAAVPVHAGRGGHPVLLSPAAVRRVARARTGRLDRLLRALGPRLARVATGEACVVSDLDTRADLRRAARERL